MANTYQTYYFVESCTKESDTTFQILLEKRVPSTDTPPTPIRISGGKNPITISYKDNGDLKTTPCRGTEVKLVLLSDGVFNGLNAVDEREWRISLTMAGVLAGRWFVLPDDGAEPFATKPFPISVRGTDILGTLKDIPLFALGEIIPKTPITALGLLVKILNKTELGLNIVIADNTFEKLMNRNPNTQDCPWNQLEMSLSRFMDVDRLPFSCFDVLKSLLATKSCSLCQIKGKWWVINQEELNRGLEAIPYREYTSAGVYVTHNTLNDIAVVGGNGRQSVITADNHTLRNAKAHLSDTTYYQYGYASNQLENGDFDDWPVPLLLPTGWKQVGGCVVVKDEKKDVAGNYTGNYRMRVIKGDNRNGKQFIQNEEGVQIRANESVAISFDWGLENPGNVWQILNHNILLYVMMFTDDGYAYTGSSWKTYSFGSPQEIKYKDGEVSMSNEDYGYGQVSERKTVNITIPARDKDYKLFLGLGTVFRREFLSDPDPVTTLYDNVQIRPSVVDDAIKPPLGRFTTHTQDKPLSYVPEPVVILNGDDTNEQRTSWLRVTGHTVNTQDWYRRGEVLPTPLLSIITGNSMQLHSRPYKIFEVDLVKIAVWPYTRANIDLLDSHFVFLSGDIDILNERSDLKLAEQVLGVAPVTEYTAEDYGNKKDKNGVSVGTIGGINTGGGSNGSNGSNGVGSKWTDRYKQIVWINEADEKIARFTTNFIDTFQAFSKTEELMFWLKEIDTTPPQLDVIWNLSENMPDFLELNLHLRRQSDGFAYADYYSEGSGIIGANPGETKIKSGEVVRAEVSYDGGAIDGSGNLIEPWDGPVKVSLEVLRNGTRMDIFEEEYLTPPQRGSLGVVYYTPVAGENWEVRAWPERIGPVSLFTVDNSVPGIDVLALDVNNGFDVIYSSSLGVGITNFTYLLTNYDVTNFQINNNSESTIKVQRANAADITILSGQGVGTLLVDGQNNSMIITLA